MPEQRPVALVHVHAVVIYFFSIFREIQLQLLLSLYLINFFVDYEITWDEPLYVCPLDPFFLPLSIHRIGFRRDSRGISILFPPGNRSTFLTWNHKLSIYSVHDSTSA